MAQRKSPAREGEAGVLLAVEPSLSNEFKAAAQLIAARFTLSDPHSKVIVGLLWESRS